MAKNKTPTRKTNESSSVLGLFCSLVSGIDYLAGKADIIMW
jgi:hypothetical protein